MLALGVQWVYIISIGKRYSGPQKEHKMKAEMIKNKTAEGKINIRILVKEFGEYGATLAAAGYTEADAFTYRIDCATPAEVDAARAPLIGKV